MRLVGLSGSLRGGSFNTALLRTALERVPAGWTPELVSLRELPLYDADLPLPDSVAAFKASLATADVVLVATPEYNHSIPGVLKNALDWASRPAFAGPLAGRRAGIVSASASFVGGARAQQHLKNVLASMGVDVYPGNEFLLGNAGERVVDGRLVDPKSLQILDRYLADFATWLRRGSPAGA